MRSGKAQPVQVDDWEDSNAEGVRNLFSSPDGAQRREDRLRKRRPEVKNLILQGHWMKIWQWRYFAQLKCWVPFGFFQLGKRQSGRSKMLTSLLKLVNTICQSVMSRILSQRALRLG